MWLLHVAVQRRLNAIKDSWPCDLSNRSKNRNSWSSFPFDEPCVALMTCMVRASVLGGFEPTRKGRIGRPKSPMTFVVRVSPRTNGMEYGRFLQQISLTQKAEGENLGYLS